jgi:hypothetical protein
VALFDIKEPNCIAMRFADKLAPDCLHLLCNSLCEGSRFVMTKVKFARLIPICMEFYNLESGLID